MSRSPFLRGNISASEAKISALGHRFLNQEENFVPRISVFYPLLECMRRLWSVGRLSIF